MKELKQSVVHWIYLEGYGDITIAEASDGVWHLDIFPDRNRKSDMDNLRIQTQFSDGEGKSFEFVKEVFQNKQQPSDTRSTTEESEPQTETGAQTPPPPNVV